MSRLEELMMDAGAVLIALLACWLAVAAEARAAAPATDLGATNTVLMVDQDGRVNVPGVLATQADLASNRVATAVAAAKADAAAQSAAHASAMVDTVAASIASGELVVYRQGSTDGFSAAVTLPEDTGLRITAFEPCISDPSIEAGEGHDVHRIWYAVDHDPGGSTLTIGAKHSADAEQWGPVAEADTGAPVPVEGTYSLGGHDYPWRYKVDYRAPVSDRGFYIVQLAGDEAGTGFVLDIRNGVRGGVSSTNIIGNQQLVFRGGVLVSVSPVPPPEEEGGE